MRNTGRPILFKGYDPKTKKEIRGSLCLTPFGTFIEWYQHSICNRVKVEPNSIKQFIGLKDRLNNRIFEGDLLQHIKTKVIYRVQFKDAAFYLSCKNSNVFMADINKLTIQEDCLKHWEIYKK